MQVESNFQTRDLENNLSPIIINKPPLSDSQHNPDNGFLAFMSNLIKNPREDGSVLITAENVKTFATLLNIEKLTNLKTLSNIETITSRLDNIEKSIASPASKPIPVKISPNSWANVTKKHTVSPHLSTNPAHPIPLIPTTKIINEFKPTFFVIRKSNPDSRPFFQKSPAEITHIVNTILQYIKAKTSDGTDITVKGVATLPSGDFKFFVQSRFFANWLLENKHIWTQLCNNELITPQSVFPVIIHSVPISFTPSIKATINELCVENKINPDEIQNVRWLGNPQLEKKSHSSIIINFLNKDIAHKIEKGGLFYKYLYLQGAHFKKSPIQCFNCLEVGHTAQFCKNDPLCKNCGDNHNSRNCIIDVENDKCIKCIKHEKEVNTESFDENNLRFNHSPLSIKCPLKTKNFRRLIINQ